jgi:transcriptional regulator with XRE-family HTH domain
MEVNVDKLKELRLDQGLSQRQLAERAGVSNTTVANIEQHKSGAHPGTMYKLAAALGVEPRELRKRG